MTAPIQEPTTDRALQGLAYQRDQIFRRPAPQVSPQWAIKLFSDTQATTVGDDRFRFTIPHTMPGWYLTYVELGLGEPDTYVTEAMLRNVDNGDVDMLTTAVTIDAGEHSSQTAATQFVIKTAGDADQVQATDRIAVDVDDGFDGTGLHIYVWFQIVRPV